MSDSPLPEQTSPNEKPGWLARLEEESWQAELIVSGAAIFGALQLPALMSQLDDYLLYTVNRGATWFWMAFSMFANIMIMVLIATFLLHFALRTLWIGMVGFNSVYPQGFKPNPNFSEDYQEKMRAEFGDINGYIKKLDRRCSSIFGSGFNIVLISLGWMTIILLLGVLAYWFRDYVDESFTIVVGLGLYGLIMLFAMVSMVMNLPRFRETEWAKRYQFPMATIMSRLMYQLAYRPVNIVTNLVATNHVTSKWAPLKVLGYAMLVGMAIGVFLAETDQKYVNYIDKIYHRMASDTTILPSKAYADKPCNCQVYRPVIPSEEIRDKSRFTIFVPLPNREYFELLDQCSLPEVSDDFEGNEARNRKRNRLLGCAREYISIYLNDREIRDYDLLRHFFGENRQFGVMATLINQDFQPGKNWIKVVTNYLNDEGEPRTTYTPVYYLPENTPAS